MFSRGVLSLLGLYAGMTLALVGLLASAAIADGSSGTGSVTLTTIGSASTQNFDGLNTTSTSTLDTPLLGWHLTEVGSSAAADGKTVAADGGSAVAGAKSYGAATGTERALGSLAGGPAAPIVFGAQFKNGTGSTIGTLGISYTGEQWRRGTTSGDVLTFEYSTNATSLSTGTWTGVTALNFTNPITAGTAGALDGNLAGNRSAKSAAITGLSITDGSSFWIRWTDLDTSGSDEGLAIDDFALTPTVPVELRAFKVE